MFRIKYAPLITVKVTHPYYQDLVSPDFAFSPLPSTRRQLESLGLVARAENGKLYIYQQQTAAGEPIDPIDTDIDLLFTIQPITDILNITRAFGSRKYWLSNLYEDGSLRTVVTRSAQLSAADVLPPVNSQSLRITPAEGEVIQQVVLKEVKTTDGLKPITTIDVAAGAPYVDLTVPSPGWYVLEKVSAAGTTANNYVFSDYLAGTNQLWGVLHLRLGPTVPPQDLTLPLAPKDQKWQYLIIEPETDSIGPAAATNYRIEYQRQSTRFPEQVTFQRLDRADFTAELRQAVATLTASSSVRAVHVLESEISVPILEDKPPVLKLLRNDVVKAKKLDTPNRTMTQTRLNYII